MAALNPQAASGSGAPTSANRSSIVQSNPGSSSPQVGVPSGVNQKLVAKEALSFSGNGFSVDVASEDGSLRNERLHSFQGQSTDTLNLLISGPKQVTLNT